METVRYGFIKSRIQGCFTKIECLNPLSLQEGCTHARTGPQARFPGPFSPNFSLCHSRKTSSLRMFTCGSGDDKDIEESIRIIYAVRSE